MKTWCDMTTTDKNNHVWVHYLTLHDEYSCVQDSSSAQTDSYYHHTSIHQGMRPYRYEILPKHYCARIDRILFSISEHHSILRLIKLHHCQDNMSTLPRFWWIWKSNVWREDGSHVMQQTQTDCVTLQRIFFKAVVDMNLSGSDTHFYLC